MPTYKPYTKHQLAFILNKIGNAVYTPVADLDMQAWWSKEPLPYDARTTGKLLNLKIGDTWGKLFDCAWFYFTGEVPVSAQGKHVVLLLDVNGEMCVFDEDGTPVRGLTNVSSTYDFSLGKPGKHVLQFANPAQGGEAVDLWVDAACNDLFGEVREDGKIRQAEIAVCDDSVRALYYDYEVLLDFLRVLPEKSPRYQQILTGLNDVAALVGYDVPANAAEAREILKPLLSKQGGDPSLRISAIGHAHMDLAWLWPIRETIRKGARTFSTAIELADRYPDYKFGASQAQYFYWMKQHYPGLYEKMKQAVAKGSLEPQGAAWVEADMNISGGEALARQLLLGKRFFKQEFGVDIRYLWLPDVFGYNGALPQLLRLADVDYFSTQKLSWSLINRFPHHSFHWQGIDGTTILTHLLPEDTYNSPAAPRSAYKMAEEYLDSGVSDRALMVFGIGDGGGGPGAEHLERLKRIKNLAGLSPVKQEWAADFFEDWKKDADRFATWTGELYLERHEGTLTTEARNKWYNRKMELGLRDLEWAAVLGGVTTGTDYPADFLLDTWREVLLYQFHDILPGSSIKRVYDESVARYAEMYTQTRERTSTFLNTVSEQVNTKAMDKPVIVFNSLSWPREEWVKAGNAWHNVTVPAMGYCAIETASSPAESSGGLTAQADCLENDVLKVSFGENGAITSVLDKRVNREVLSPGTQANRLAVYYDPGDAWDFPMDYANQTPRYMELVSTDFRVDGPRAVVHQVYKLGYSELSQDIILTQGSARLDFVTDLHWRETASMLRTSFPVDVQTTEAICNIQYGHLSRPTHRNTTWDMAKDEIAAHKWVDLSQRDYGVALLNDSKYGYKVKDNILDLNLLRSAPYPGSQLLHTGAEGEGEPNHTYTDQCDHRFSYALLPHSGDLVEGGVLQAGYEFNVPLQVVPTTSHAGTYPASHSFISVSDANVIVEAVKQAEDSNDVIVRLYEASGASTTVTVKFGFPVADARLVNLMERELDMLGVSENGVTLSFHPFEIKSIALKRA